MTKTTFAVLCGLALFAVVALLPAPGPGAARLPAALSQVVLASDVGFSVLPDGRGGTNVESIVYPETMGFDKKRSLEAFESTVYPLLRANCSLCHSTQNKAGSGAQAPLHSDIDVNLAHEYALARVNFREPASSKLVVRMLIDRHNCFGETCAAAGAKMLAAVTAWRDAVADMTPDVPRGVEASRKISDEQVLEWIAADDVLHWLAWNIPAKAGGIPEGPLPEGAISGTAGVGRGSYFGPGAPAGPRYHHYVFELYALSKVLDLPADATRAQLLDAMKDAILGKAAYVGRFHQ